MNTANAEMQICVVGASGFIGSTCTSVLSSEGWTVTPVPAPRLQTSARTTQALVRHLEIDRVVNVAVDRLQREFRRADVVVNAAGLATPDAESSDDLFGANSLLPGLVVRAATDSGVRRLVHLSSAAVQGSASRLDETTSVAPLTPYGLSKALGEAVALVEDRTHVLRILRPTSVHGVDRPTSAKLARLAASPFSSVAGRGDAPTPQVLACNVARAVGFLAARQGPVPRIVLQPDEGLTTRALLCTLGGREPVRLPVTLTKFCAGALKLALAATGRNQGVRRRLEMLWFGQRQVQSSLLALGYQQRTSLDEWVDLGRHLRRVTDDRFRTQDR